MIFREWFRPPRHVLLIFLIVAIVSAVALGWLASLLLRQEKAVETQRRQETLEQVADRAVALMQGALAALDVQLASRGARSGAPPAGVVIINVAAGRTTVQPEGGLIYYPEDFPRVEAPDGPFAEGEQAEFARKDLQAAARLYSKLTAETNAAVAAAAWTRLARVYRKMENDSAALEAYDRVFQISGASVSGLPAGLIAREGRASIFERSHREKDLREEAMAIRADLLSGRWQLTKSQYEFYSAEAAQWAGMSAEASAENIDGASRAEAFAWLWGNRRALEPANHRLIETSARSALVMWSKGSDETFTAAIGGPDYLASVCRDAVSDTDMRCTLSDPEGRIIFGEQPPARYAVVRTAAAAKLPWTLQVFSGAAVAVTASPQRQLLLWVLAVLAAVWCAGAGFIMRAISREMRVARLQSDFVAAVSHEFRSPLSSLRQISEMLTEDRIPSENARRESYGVLARESERLHHLVEDLLDFGRFDAGRAIYHFKSLELRGFLQILVADFQGHVAALGYRVELNLPPSDIRVRADAAALSRAIWNLLDNAVKYSPNSPAVWVDVEATEHRVSIAVRDHGLGIPLREQREIFENFVRGSESKALRIKGTGIGLAMVRHIIQAHGGEILLASEPGRGSRFTMVLDTTRSASATARSQKESAS